ncbi:conserved hypothetical protein [Histoplasma capsulatum H143]|uniref:SAP domain-containing protein n=1 Tax=Ajellomyces capsulatus (strain H143) TaxID=544712 RepID=C6H7Y7_AJECH|nr:conserved hypothetical protein [Histoplasma capsulatum H143]
MMLKPLIGSTPVTVVFNHFRLHADLGTRFSETDVPTVQELRRQLKALGLSSTGRKASLLQRLQTAQETLTKSDSAPSDSAPSDSAPSDSAPSDSPRTPDDHCDAIAAATIEIADPEIMIEQAQVMLKGAIDNHQLQFQTVRDMPVVTNRRGVRYAEGYFDREAFASRLETTENALENFKTELESIKTELESIKSELKNECESLRRTVSNLQHSVGDLKDSRSLFISTYRRDILLNATPSDHRIISTGNRFVHGGDCKRDAGLYEHPGRRRDFDTYVKLYGLHPGIVQSSVSYTATINLLNTHATIIADKNIKVSTDFHDLFDDFIRSLERSNYDEEYLNDPMSRVTLAYWAFLKVCPT